MRGKHLLVRFVLVILGALAVALFIIPLTHSASVNIGSVTGIVCSLLLLCYGLFMNPFHRLLGKIWKKKAGKWFLSLCAVVLSLIAGCVITETIFMIKGANTKPLGDEVVVVLGCRAYKDKPSLSMIERLDEAYGYLQEHKECTVILSGGQGEGETLSEAEVMYQYLKELGIEEQRMIKEDRSRDTFENLSNVKKIMEERGLGKEVAIVTSEYHAYRSSLIAKEVGLESTSIPAKTAWWLFPTYYVREMYGILHQWIFGR